MPILSMEDVDLTGKKILIREDFNVPVKGGSVISDARITAALPTILAALNSGSQVILMSHLGRPVAGSFNADYSLAPVAAGLSKLLGINVPLISDWLDGFEANDQLVLLENVRFMVGETDNDKNLAQKMASLCDVFILDAFATAHRNDASVCGVADYAPIACAGKLLLAEINSLNKIMQTSEHPKVAIVGGAKVSTKIHLLESLISKVDVLLLGGGIANTFLACHGYDVGNSIYEEDLLDEAERLIHYAQTCKVTMPIVEDVLVHDITTNSTSVRVCNDVAHGERIIDIGPDTVQQWSQFITTAKTILWNGPVGAFEIEEFASGTKAIANAVANSKAFVVAGGGDTVAAIEKFNIAANIDYISTGGGAFLAFLEGKTLPAIAALERAYI